MKAKEIQQHDIIAHGGHQVYVSIEPFDTHGGFINLRGVTAIDGRLVSYYTNIDYDTEIVKLSRVDPVNVLVAAFEEVKEKKGKKGNPIVIDAVTNDRGQTIVDWDKVNEDMQKESVS